jgi:hypothetical protein
MKGARERAWLVGDPTWMRRWLIERANAGQGSNLELKSRFGAKCLELAAAHAPGLVRKALPSTKSNDPNSIIPHWVFEPRVPAGNGDPSGEWTKLAGLYGMARVGAATLRYGRRRRQGHHFVARAIYKDKPLSAEARKVFDEATTGKLYYEGNNLWDAAHRVYRDAVEKELTLFMQENDISWESMTGDQARAFVKRIKESQIPAIRNFNRTIKMRELVHKFRIRFPLRGID